MIHPRRSRSTLRPVRHASSWLALLLIALPALADADRAVLLDGSTAQLGERIASIAADGKVAFEGGKEPVELQGLRRIERVFDAPPAPDAAPTPRVYLAGGGSVRVRSVTAANDRCVMALSLGAQLSAPIEAVRAIRFNLEPDPKKLPQGHEGFELAALGPAADKDRVFVVIEDKVQSLQGVVGEITEEKITFEWEKQQRTIERGKAFGVVLAGTGKTVDLTGRCLVTTQDRSTFWAQVVSMHNGILALKLHAGADLKLPWAAVSRLDVRSDRLAFLSDLEPAAVYEKSLAQVGSWQRDRSVRGKPMTLAGKTYEKGIGVHAVCRLTYTGIERYDTFAATIGIDDETKGKGDCIFVVTGDDKELFRQRVTAATAPAPIRLKVTGVKRLTLAVEAGEDFDLSDHANWADVRLIREGK